MSSPKPKYLYKIVPFTSPVPAISELPERLPLSALDESDGFIHLSTGDQVCGTLNMFFADDESVHILRIVYEDVKDTIKWESPPGNCAVLFPHLYNGQKLGKDEVERVEIVGRAAGESNWDSAIAKVVKDWLV